MVNLQHPLRRRVLELLAEHEELSPSQIAELLHENGERQIGKIGNVSYHVRQLHDAKIIRLTRTEPVRGTLEHFYRLDKRHTKTEVKHLRELADRLERAIAA